MLHVAVVLPNAAVLGRVKDLLEYYKARKASPDGVGQFLLCRMTQLRIISGPVESAKAVVRCSSNVSEEAQTL